MSGGGERIVFFPPPSVINYSSDSFTPRILYHMTLNITSLGSTPDLRNPPLPLSHPQTPTAPASLRAGSSLEQCTKGCLPHWRASVSCRRPTTGDATRHVFPSLSLLVSRRNEASVGSFFIFAESDTDWCDPLIEICLSHYYCQALLGVPFKIKPHCISFKRVAVILFPRHYTRIHVSFIFSLEF